MPKTKQQGKSDEATKAAEDVIDEIYQELEDMMDPEYTRVQLVRKIKMMLSVIDEYTEAQAQQEAHEIERNPSPEHSANP